MRKTTLSVEMSAGTPLVDLEPILAWAKDASSGRPRYILELGAHERGARCGCVCPVCGMALTAVNAAVDLWKKRPHFRHPTGAERASCNLLAARYALLEALRGAGELVLPRRRRSATAIGLSGAPYTARVEDDEPQLRFRDVRILDLAAAVLKLDDGRELVVRLCGSVDRTQSLDEACAASITMIVDDPAIAAMSPQELLERLQLIADGASWHCHWRDAALDHQAMAKARADAEGALDFDGQDDPFAGGDEIARAQRRESLLHAEVKLILAQSSRIMVPPLEVAVTRDSLAGTPHWRFWGHPAESLEIRSVALEQHLGGVVPDVVATLAPHRPDGLALDEPAAGHPIHGKVLLVEVTVSNLVDDERLQRIERQGLASLEIDLSRTGGHITRDALRSLVVEDLQCKRWLYHPQIAARNHSLGKELDSFVDGVDRQAKVDAAAAAAARSMSTEQIGKALLAAVQAHCMFMVQSDRVDRTGEERARLLDMIDASSAMATALARKGYPEALDTGFYMHYDCVLSKLLSIKLDTGVGYRYNNAWQVINAIRCETGVYRRMHTMYLFAAKIYVPRLDERQRKLIDKWREEVRVSREKLQSDSPYRRDTRYDRVLCILFPEMAEHLSKPPPKAGDQGRTARPAPSTAGARQTRTAHSAPRDSDRGDYLHGEELEAWLATKSPEEAAYWRRRLDVRTRR